MPLEGWADIVGYADAARSRLPGAGVPWLDGLRRGALARFNEQGLPDRRTESWKYTSLARAPIRFPETAPDPADMAGRHAVAEPWFDGPALVLVDGRLSPALSRLDDLPAGLAVADLCERLGVGDDLLSSHIDHLNDGVYRPFFALNTALIEGGAVLRIKRRREIARPVEIVHLSTGRRTALPRLLIIAEAGARACLVERFVTLSAEPYLTVPAAEISVGAGARLQHVRVQQEGAGATHLSTTLARLSKESDYASFSLSLGGRLARHEVGAVLGGPNSTLGLSGIYIGSGNQVHDATTLIDHAYPDCRSREVFKGVLDDRSRGVFQGKILVRREAQRTDGYQLGRALLLSPRAEADAKPELEIYADDVRCSHGATTGQIDEEALFYLRSRGINQARARAMLTEAFIIDALEEIADEEVRGRCAAEVRGRLGELA